MRVFRWKAIIPLVLVLGLVSAGWYLLLDSAVRRGIEVVATDLVGAKVDLAAADVRLGDGSVVLRGLQVTNPDAPMTNLFQVDEIIADINLGPLLQKKIFIDTVAVRGLRFDTPRETSGAIEHPDPETGALRRRVASWAEGVPVPDFSLDGLTGAVNVAAIQPENLRTPNLALGVRRTADSVRQAWTAQLEALNPEPVIDSALALVQRLQGETLQSLGLQGAARAVSSMRTALEAVSTMQTGVQQLGESIGTGMRPLEEGVAGLAAARAEDLASARDLLQIPSLDAPDISPALFGEVALARIQPVLYWAQMLDRYLRPGLDPRQRAGPARARLSGSSVEFPMEHGLAGLTVAFAEIEMQLAGDGAAAGNYRVEIVDYSSAPSIHGRPVRIAASRTDAGSGPDAVELVAVLNHVRREIRDSLSLRIAGVGLPSVTLPGIGSRMDLGQGVNELVLARTGDSIAGRWLWNASQVSWDRGSIGSGRVNDVLWRTLSALRTVDVEVRISGHIAGPRLTVRSNLASEISRSLRRELASEVAAAEQRVRAEVERLVAAPIADATSRVLELETTVQALVAQHQRRLDEVKAELEAKLRPFGR